MRSFFTDDRYATQGARDAFALVSADYIEAVVLTANTAASVPIPAGAVFANFSFNGDFWLKAGDASTPLIVPSTTTTDGSAGEFNPAARRIPRGATHLRIISSDALKGSVSFYGG